MFRKYWLRLPIDSKVRQFAFSVIFIIVVTSALSIMAVNFAMSGFGAILNDNKSCQEFMSAIEREALSYRTYLNDRTEENHNQFLSAALQSERSLHQLPFDYSWIGEKRYAQTWNILNAYENYKSARDQVLGNVAQSKVTSVNKLYLTYDMQEHLANYSRRLLQMTVEAGTVNYNQKLPLFKKITFLLINIALLLCFIAFSISRLMTTSIVEPVLKLSSEAKKISENDFSSEDLSVPNKDELGELVGIFNNMKHSTENYINTLKDNYHMTELLQKKQLENMEIEKRLDQNRLELLKSQINPHFLFNTLNMIGSMANVEDADSTEKMINSLSAIFRYNLSTREQTVLLSRELETAENYIYLQKMRFGNRIRYHVSVPQDIGNIVVPSFMLQPLLENAIVHGLSRKEEGGDIWLRVVRKDGQIGIFITDTGMGMKEERLKEMRSVIKSGQAASLGIGLGNICQRVLTLYRGSAFDIYSREGRGTSIVIHLPEDGPVKADV